MNGIGRITKKIIKASAVLVIALVIIMMVRGFNFSAFMGSIANASTDNPDGTKIENGIQLVTTKLESGRYAPITVRKGIPVKWNIRVEAGELNGCNNSVTIPEYRLQKKLSVGDNIIEFTPEKEGNFVYTCWMGMISSNIKVVSDTSNLSAEDLPDTSAGDNGSNGQAGAAAIPVDSRTAGSKAAKFHNGSIPTDEVAVGTIVNGTQTVTINVNDYGISPAVAVVQKGVETVVNFNGEKINSCNNRIILSNYGAGIDLTEGENKIEFVPEEDFSFGCWMGMINGYIKVVDDINNFDLDSVKKEVENIDPASGYGGNGEDGEKDENGGIVEEDGSCCGD